MYSRDPIYISSYVISYSLDMLCYRIKFDKFYVASRLVILRYVNNFRLGLSKFIYISLMLLKRVCH